MTFDVFDPDPQDAGKLNDVPSHDTDGPHPEGSSYHTAAALLAASVDVLLSPRRLHPSFGSADEQGGLTTSELERWLDRQTRQLPATERWAAFECLYATLHRWTHQAGHPHSFDAILHHHPTGIPTHLHDACELLTHGYAPRVDDGPPPHVADPDGEPGLGLDGGYEDTEPAWFTAAVYLLWGTVSVLSCATGASYQEVADALPSFAEHPDLPGHLGRAQRMQWLGALTAETEHHGFNLPAAAAAATLELEDPDGFVPFEGFDLVDLDENPHPDAVAALRSACSPTETMHTAGQPAAAAHADDRPMRTFHQWQFEHDGVLGFAAATFTYPAPGAAPVLELTDEDTAVFAVDGMLYPHVWAATGRIRHADDPVRAAVAATLAQVKCAAVLQLTQQLLAVTSSATAAAEHPPQPELE